MDKKKTVHILTLFPEYFSKALFAGGVVGKAVQSGKLPVNFNVVDLQDQTVCDCHKLDSYPYGGGPGQLMRADILEAFLAIKVKGYAIREIADLRVESIKEGLRIIFLGPWGKKWGQNEAQNLCADLKSTEDTRDIVLICGRYEGIDQRFIDLYVDTIISAGDFILSGAEVAAMVVLDSTLRLIDGVLHNQDSLAHESFSQGELEGKQYTRPRVFRGLEVPSVLVGGNHKLIADLHKSSSREITKKYRPDLLDLGACEDL